MESTANLSVWVIIPVHNRRETTLQCLAHLEETQSSEHFELLVIDDGSTDGTSDAIRKRHPGVNIVEGDGSLWWGGSIKKGMEFARDSGADVFVWLNDDVLPEPHGVIDLAKKVYERGDTVLTTVVQTEFESDYTTRNKVTRWGIQNLPYETSLEIQPCDATAGKFTAFPAEIVDIIGLPDSDRFPHHHCDYDYTFRAKEHGFDVGVYSEVGAIDTGYNPDEPLSRLSPNLSLEGLIKNTFDTNRHLGYTLRTMYYHNRRFYGPPIIIPYTIIISHLIQSLGAIVIKGVLTAVKSEHSLRD